MTGLIENETPAYYAMNGRKLERLPADFYSSRSYTDFLIKAIREHHYDGKPFLAYLAFTAPHDPLHVPEPWLSKYRGQYDEGYEVLKKKRADSAKRLGLVPDSAEVSGRHPMIKG
jgi:arylsulfatase A-like enzyme